MSEETVKLNVLLAWSYAANAEYETEWDTEISLDDWNAMSDEARQKEMDTAFDEVMSNQSNCGVWVTTPGATE